MKVAASSTGAAPAVTIDPSEQEIPAGESATFTVTPAENLATDTPYPDNILLADKNNSDNKIIVPVNVTIPAPAVSNVTRDPKDGPDFGTLVDGYTELPAPQTITLTNEGNADAVLSDAVSSTGAARDSILILPGRHRLLRAELRLHLQFSQRSILQRMRLLIQKHLRLQILQMERAFRSLRQLQ